jgi:hypothetical protein
MDPDRTWVDILALARRLQNVDRSGNVDVGKLLDDGERLAQQIMTLQEWLNQGGKAPKTFLQWE